MAFNPEAEQKSLVTAELKKVGHTLVSAADAMGVPYQHLANVARGRTHARQEVIDGFLELTGKPLKGFVCSWVLSKPYNPVNASK